MIEGDPLKELYLDQALTPAIENDFSTLELFNQNAAARHAAQHERHVQKLTEAATTHLLSPGEADG
jgi:hypothetical protein